MVLRDRLFQSMTYENWKTAVDPKIMVAGNLDSVPADRPLDFLMTSSVSCVLGNPAQSNYAAANIYLDSFARRRLSATRRELEQSLERKGVYGVDKEHLLQSFKTAVISSKPERATDHIVVGLGPAKLKKAVSDTSTLLLRTPPGGSGGAQSILATIKEAASSAEAGATVREHFNSKLARMLLPGNDAFDADVKPIASYGIHSMIGAEIPWYGAAPPDEERLAFLDRAHQLGAVHWDSAKLYGDNEELLGKWFQRTGKRKDFGINVHDDGRWETRNDPAYIRHAVADSLRKLQTDYIDLLYCHRISGKTPVEEMVAAMKEFVDAGKVRYLGLSECGVDTLRRAVKVHPIHAYQIEYSPFDRHIEKPEVGLLQTCRELGIATVAYSPLGRGMLTGQYTCANDFEQADIRRFLPRFSDENFPKNIKLVNTLKEIAASKKCTPGQLTLAWIMSQGDDIFPIPGTKKIRYLEENLGALALQLTDEENQRVRGAIDGAEVHGTRVLEPQLGALVRDTPPLR
ncbi:hypothetical protein DL769_005300 [Monosporascus sp. CRB-8-3]|nr:hypothetical protein DL769_005300 [Monosporascus sp. CRB-8-3]